jgi:hypothetical protein
VRKRIGIAAIGGIALVVWVLFILGGVKLTDFTTQLAVGLALLIPVIVVLMFKPEINSWTLSRHSQKVRTEPVMTAVQYQGLVGTEAQIMPALEFGGLVVRKTTNFQHGGTYRRSVYFVKLINTTPNTLSKNCRGSIILFGSDILNRSTIWENNYQVSINIGHEECLFLFRTETFRAETGPESTRLYFSHPLSIDFVDERSRDVYDDNLDRRLRLLVQSENARFPSEEQSFNKSIRQLELERTEMSKQVRSILLRSLCYEVFPPPRTVL